MSTHSVDGVELAHHFDSVEQQQESQLMGMWLFLVTEVMFFGGIFICYAVYRYLYPEAYSVASRELNVTMGAVNTGVLLCSSFAMALAVKSSMHRERGNTFVYLVLTALMGTAFLVVKGFEYAEKFHHHFVPGAHFNAAHFGPHAKAAELFFGLYFVMTGVHAFHMIIGISVLGLLIYRSVRWPHGPTYMSVELTGLYWHFVDVVWVFLFPLLYLIDISHK